MHDYIMIYVRPTAACLLPCHGLTLPSFRLLLYLSMPADMAAISFGPNIIIGSFALIAIQLAAPLDRLDDSLRLVRHHSGFLNLTDYVTLKLAPMHGPWERLPKLMQVDTAEQFCARRGVDCSAAVRAAAPDDHRLYELVVKLFDAQWRAHLGDLATSSHSATTTARDDDSRLRGKGAGPGPGPSAARGRGGGRGRGGSRRRARARSDAGELEV
jgi:hypothetical protein